MTRTVWNTGGCTSWYLDANGRNTTIWPGTTTEFRTATRRVDLAEYDVIRPARAAERRRRAGRGRRQCRRARPRHLRPLLPARPRRELTAVSADGTRLHVEVHGPEGAPAVVLAHGWTCSTAFWAAQIRELAADHRVDRLRPARTRPQPAPPSAAGYSTDPLADDLEAVLAATLAAGASGRCWSGTPWAV